MQAYSKHPSYPGYIHRRSILFGVSSLLMILGGCSADVDEHPAEPVTHQADMEMLDASPPANDMPVDMPTVSESDMESADLSQPRPVDLGSDMAVNLDMPDESPDGDMAPPEPEDMPIAAGCDGPESIHVAPTALGSGDGSTAQNAAAFADLNTLIANRGTKELICLGDGEYEPGMVVQQGGSAESPLVIRGSSDHVVFRGSFVANETNKFGSSALTIKGSYLTIESIRCEEVGQCIKIPAGETLVVEHLTLRDLFIKHVGTAIDVARNGGETVRDLSIEDVMILQFSRGGIFLAANTADASIARVYIDMQPAEIGGRGSDYPVGIALYDEAQDVEISNVTVLNILGKTDGYSQGDGLDGERTARRVQIKSSFFAGHRDGCVDAKTREMLISDTIAVNCKRNFRLWQNDEGDGPRCLNCESYQPRDAHIFTRGNSPAYFDNLGVYSDNNARLVVYDGPGEVIVDGLRGTLSSEDRLNATSVTNSSLTYGGTFMTPAPPNPTRFTP